LITLAGGSVVGAAIGAASAYFYTKWKYDVVRTELILAIDDLERERHQNNVERAARNSEVEQIATVSRELKEMGITMLKEVRGDGWGNSVDEADEEFSVFDSPPAMLVTAETEGVDVVRDSVTRNIFDDTNDEWDYEKELLGRGDIDPYIIHADEFEADENDWNSHTTLTWYEGDQILADSSDLPVYNHHTVVGNANLRFGHGSGQADVVYIRNPRLEAEYEVIREPGSYEVLVLGGDGVEEQYATRDLKHSKAPLRFRPE
jgi:hypothetical protein